MSIHALERPSLKHSSLNPPFLKHARLRRTVSGDIGGIGDTGNIAGGLARAPRRTGFCLPWWRCLAVLHDAAGLRKGLQ